MNQMTNVVFQKMVKVAKSLISLCNPFGEKTQSTNKNDKSNNSKRETDFDMIINHPCFTELSIWKSTKTKHLAIQDPSKKEMAKAYIHIICEICEKKASSIKDMNVNELARLFMNGNISNITSDTLDEVNTVAAAEGIPYIFIDKNNEIIYNYIEAMTDSINDLLLYRQWKSDTEKVLAILDILYTTIHIIGEEIPHIVNTMNGELKMALKGSKYDVGID